MQESQLSHLRNQGRFELASLLEQAGSQTLSDYAQSLYQHTSSTPIEPELLAAFEHHLAARHSFELTQTVLHELQSSRVLQTSHHLTATEGPTFFAINVLSNLGLTDKQPYCVAAYSNVPFANSAWSGCLNYGRHLTLEELLSPDCPSYKEHYRAQQDRSRDTIEQRLSLVPGKQRDAMVYHSLIPDKLGSLLPYLKEELQPILPDPKNTPYYSSWALTFCERITQQLFPQRPVVYLDINEVISSYLQQVLKKTDHPITQMLIHPELLKHFTEVHWFSQPYSSKNKEKILSITPQNAPFEWKPEVIRAQLTHHQLSPATFPVFLTLCFLNSFKCLGSFQQVEYLKAFKEQLSQISELHNVLQLETPTNALTTGRLIDKEGYPIFPLECILQQKDSKTHNDQTFLSTETQTLWEWILPLLERL